MSLPTLTYTKGSTVGILMPPRWTMSVSAVTGQAHNQLIRCRWQDGRTPRSAFLANEWETPHVPMIDLADDTSPQLKLRMQGIASEVTLAAYHSTDRAVSGKALWDDKYSSTEVEVITVPSKTEEPPDSVTFFIAVQDAPASEEGLRFHDLPGIPQTVEYFYYFKIESVPQFRRAFGKFMLRRITDALLLATFIRPPRLDYVGVNVGFTSRGLLSFDLNHWSLKDKSFSDGQYYDSQYLGDSGTGSGDGWTPDWDKDFKQPLDGVFLITAYVDFYAQNFMADMEAAFAGAFRSTFFVKCDSGPAPEKYNHFGWRGGMSNPQIRRATFETRAQPEIRYPGSSIIPMGTIVMGYDGDEDKYSRPDWAKNGAFMVTRHLNTLAPEFDAFLVEKGPIVFPNLPVQEAADKLGARLFGRWKDGTPTELSPDKPDPSISSDDNKINNFIFDLSAHQRRCPYAAHTRKSNPRNDPHVMDFGHSIRRQGKSFGLALTNDEREAKTTVVGRGTHFVCYSSSIVRGFKYHQCAQSNDSMFPPGKVVTPGMDPIVGQTDEKKGIVRFMTGTNPFDEERVMIFPQKCDPVMLGLRDGVQVDRVKSGKDPGCSAGRKLGRNELPRGERKDQYMKSLLLISNAINRDQKPYPFTKYEGSSDTSGACATTKQGLAYSARASYLLTRLPYESSTRTNRSAAMAYHRALLKDSAQRVLLLFHHMSPYAPLAPYHCNLAALAHICPSYQERLITPTQHSNIIAHIETEIADTTLKEARRAAAGAFPALSLRPPPHGTLHCTPNHPFHAPRHHHSPKRTKCPLNSKTKKMILATTMFKPKVSAAPSPQGSRPESPQPTREPRPDAHLLDRSGKGKGKALVNPMRPWENLSGGIAVYVPPVLSVEDVDADAEETTGKRWRGR
ncbi:hypothetical protein DXG01_013507 [Tephrocybe rancida]|nr:hypothetical protein DXG01_013507 [Tephrocybe rancida]